MAEAEVRRAVVALGDRCFRVTAVSRPSWCITQRAGGLSSSSASACERGVGLGPSYAFVSANVSGAIELLW